MKPNVHSGHFPTSPRVQMVNAVTETHILRQACLCLWHHPPELDGKLLKVLKSKRYHLGVLDRWTNFQAGWWNPHYFIGIFVPVPFQAFKARQSRSPLLLGVNDFSKLINHHSKRYPAWNQKKAPLQNLLTRVCKSLRKGHKRWTLFPARAVDSQISKLIHVSLYPILVESKWQLWCISSKPQVPPELLPGWKMQKMTILWSFWPLDDVKPRYRLQKKLKSSESLGIYPFMIKKWYSKYPNAREPWRFYRVTLCQCTNKCDAQGAQIISCAEKSRALLLHNQKCPQVNIIRTFKKP